jgi:mannose-6-phosphate isomerase-like protein (cupin superfamily)
MAGTSFRHRAFRSLRNECCQAGDLTLECGGETFTLVPGEGLEIGPGTPHQVFNNSSADVRFLVVSQPPSHGDRTDV